MLIIIKNILEVDTDEQKLALENLYRANASGKHLVITVGRKSDIRGMNLEEDFGIAAKKGYLESLRLNSEYKSFLNIISLCVEVDFADDSNQIRFSDNSYKLGYKFFQLEERAQKVTLLLENSRDSSILEKTREIFQLVEKKRIKGINFSFNVESGNGADIAAHWNTLRDNNKPFLCIVDSDKRFPDSGLGQTALSVKRGQGNEHLYESVVMGVQEIENLVPFNLIIEILTQKGACTAQAIATHDLLNDVVVESPEVLKYFDYKKGIIVKKCLDQRYKDFWVEKLNLSIDMECEQCLNSNFSSRDGQACNGCTLVSGISENLNVHAAQTLNKMTPHKIAERMLPHELDEWTRLGKLIFNWGIASEPIVAI